MKWFSAALFCALLLTACAAGASTANPTAEEAAATQPPAPTQAAPTATMPAAAEPTPSEAAATAAPTSAPTATAPLTLTSPAFAEGKVIPVRHACHGRDLSPELAWSGVPAGTLSLALVMDDPDAVPVAGFVWDHWIIFNLPADSTGLAEGVPAGDELEDGSRQGENSSRRNRYNGPCPPSGQTHGYVFSLYALDIVLDLPPGATKAELLESLAGHVLAEARLVGMYTSP